MKKLTLVFFLFAFICSNGQQRKVLNIPNLPGYVTLKCDFHIHTIFSDGSVWPSIRVLEAWRDGLDVIAITDHINYKWSFLDKYVTSKDFNNSYEIAKLTADELGITLVKGAEVNRALPPGHLNVLFATDLNRLTDTNLYVALSEAKAQGAFIQWNHPWDQKSEPIQWFDVIEKIYQKGLLNGLELNKNGVDNEQVGKWADEKGLTITCNSDIHESIDWYYNSNTRSRPVTLVFSKTKAIEDIRDAVLAGRTAALFNNSIIAKEEFLRPLFTQSVSVIDLPMIIEDKKKFVQVENKSAVDFVLNLRSKPGKIKFPQTIRLNSNSSSLFTIGIPDLNLIANKEFLGAEYEVENMRNLKGEPLIVPIRIKVLQPVKMVPYLKKPYPAVQ
jgi:predicted metal-dependent phosphoesterase TrpH